MLVDVGQPELTSPEALIARRFLCDGGQQVEHWL